MIKKSNLFSIFFLLIVSGCNMYPQDSYVQQYVVDSYLVADAPLPVVKLSHTLPATDKYTFSKVAVSGANVVIKLLPYQNQPGDTYSYEMTNYGVYTPVDNVTVLPRREYELEVTFPGQSNTITATTIVPDTFRTTSTVPDSIVYQSPNQLEIRTTQSYYPGRQNIFIFTVIANNPVENGLTPFYLDQVQSNKNVYVSDYAINQSGIVNQSNYTTNSDGTLTLQIPWLGFAFFGGNELVLNVIDNNIYDYVRSQSVQTGGSTLPPGQIQNIINHVKGGIGVFGSMATDSVHVFLKRN